MFPSRFCTLFTECDESNFLCLVSLNVGIEWTKNAFHVAFFFLVTLEDFYTFKIQTSFSVECEVLGLDSRAQDGAEVRKPVHSFSCACIGVEFQKGAVFRTFKHFQRREREVQNGCLNHLSKSQAKSILVLDTSTYSDSVRVGNTFFQSS